MQTLIFALVHLSLLFFYGLFGMSLLPSFGRSRENRDTFFLISPLVGAGVWLALTVGIGTVLPYQAPFLFTALILALIWIVFRRKALFLPETPWLWYLPLIIAVFSAIMSFGITPVELNGGIYFHPSVYDHIKCAIINSIATHGLPPVNPWLADNGTPLPLVYYYGWHAWAAQLPILTGCSGFWAECTMTGFTYLIVLLGMAGVLNHFHLKKANIASFGLLLFLCIFDFEFSSLFDRLLPESWGALWNPRGIIGFWCLLDNAIWSPQHSFASAMIILILWFHHLLLHAESVVSKKTIMESQRICAEIPGIGKGCGGMERATGPFLPPQNLPSWASLLGLLAAAAVLNSIYAGAFALVIIALLMLFDYLRSRDFRSLFNHALPWQIAAILLSLALTAFYLKFLFAYPPEEPPVAIGMMPSFGEIRHIWQYPLYFLQFYLSILPTRLGLTYICGMLAIFWPGILPKHPLISFCKKYIVASLLLIFFVHSTFYSNDFGWRFPSAPFLLLALFAVFFLYKLLVRFLYPRKRSWQIAAAVLALLLIGTGTWVQYICNFRLLKYEPSLHRTFLRALPGWKVIQSHTQKTDLVLCNPAGFYAIGKVYNSTESTNVFFSLYAQRNTPIADLIFSKCYSEFFPREKLEQLHRDVVRFFAGNPSKEDAVFIADTLKTRAILVTPLDGLWQNPGEVESRFPMKAETEHYRVYWRED